MALKKKVIISMMLVLFNFKVKVWPFQFLNCLMLSKMNRKYLTGCYNLLGKKLGSNLILPLCPLYCRKCQFFNSHVERGCFLILGSNTIECMLENNIYIVSMETFRKDLHPAQRTFGILLKIRWHFSSFG